MKSEQDDPAEAKRIQFFLRIAAVVAFAILCTGAIFYHFVEKLGWIDAIYFSTITLATVGYGDITPKTDVGKIFTVFYVLFGVGIIATFANLLLKNSVLKHRAHRSAHAKKD